MFGQTVGIVIPVLCALVYFAFLWHLRKRTMQIRSELDSNLEWIASVAEYRRKLVDKIDRLAKDDIDRGLDWEWRYQKLYQVTFDEMVNNPRIPLKV